MQPLEPTHCQESPAYPLPEPLSRPIPDLSKVNKNGHITVDIPVIYNARYVRMDLSEYSTACKNIMCFYAKADL